jgi:hypothetical protein
VLKQPPENFSRFVDNSGMTTFIVTAGIVASGLAVVIRLGSAYLNMCGPVADSKAPVAR